MDLASGSLKPLTRGARSFPQFQQFPGNIILVQILMSAMGIETIHRPQLLAYTLGRHPRFIRWDLRPQEVAASAVNGWIGIGVPTTLLTMWRKHS